MNASEGYTFDTTLKVFGGQYSNTALKPVKSDQVDLAWASYFSRDSFVSIGTFYKNLTDWQVLVPTLTDFTGVKPPSGQTPISWKGYVSQWQNTASGHVSAFEKADNPALHGLTLTFQVQNLSNTPFVTYNNGDPRQIRDYQNYGRDYMIGLRYKF